ncbi:sirohydrochlorin cobaltochelatase [bacterium]|nr:sirohydrochlorin cobaltochelatase [bacterium]
MNEPIAILLAAFGTTISQARKSYDLLEEGVRRRFPSAAVRWAYTSSIVRARLAERGEPIDSPAEALARWSQEGVDRVVVQSIHVTPGEEFLRLTGLQQERMTLIFGRPLLDQDADYEAVLDALADQVVPAVPTIFVGHGNNNDPVFNLANKRMDQLVRGRFSNAILASLEGAPGPSALNEMIPMARQVGKAHFVPLLFVAGDHVVNDLLGEEATSWKNQLGIEQVTCGPPLGQIDAIREVYIEHLGQAVRQSCLMNEASIPTDGPTIQ